MSKDPNLTETLIREVKKNPMLYDVTVPGYKNSYQKKLLWRAIADKIGGKSGEAMSWKWKNLRDSYAKHKKNLSATPPSDETTQKLIHWRWASYMTFLDPFLRKPREVMSIETEDQGETSAEETNTTFSSQLIKEEVSVNVESPEQQDSSSSGFNSRRSDDNESHKRRRRYIENDEIPIESYQLESSSNKLDKVDYLFLNYAETFKKLSPRRQVLLKLKMAEIFAKAELQELERDPIRLERNEDST